mmetsp:Transcript_57288/g.105333  ORF Transcript_57288/g.105333 Transcript_57288/m.105333 type:complete len:81 (+) Transcript_57288:1523-1765(+)
MTSPGENIFTDMCGAISSNNFGLRPLKNACSRNNSRPLLAELPSTNELISADQFLGHAAGALRRLAMDLRTRNRTYLHAF